MFVSVRMQFRSHVDCRHIGLPEGRYVTASLAEACERPVFWKSVPEAGSLKINYLS